MLNIIKVNGNGWLVMGQKEFPIMEQKEFLLRTTILEEDMDIALSLTRWETSGWLQEKAMLMQQMLVRFAIEFNMLILIGKLNDVWQFNFLNSNWMWVAGNNTALPEPIYGEKGVTSVSNMPGGRNGHIGKMLIL
jgi:hypothetical protein